MMKSKISLEIDFDSGREPFIQIAYTGSDDIRDKMLWEFLHILGGKSQWCYIKLNQKHATAEKCARIYAIQPHHLPGQAKVMKEMADEFEKSLSEKLEIKT